ncbi:MAG: MATE family efflux transporter [Euryarchaeota archaeon]|nr:MATE family efflux transporter [Euryarchaeota archaeon]
MDGKFARYRDEIINGDITKTLLTLGWPLMIGNLLHTMYNVIDTFWLGKLGKEALAAPTNTWPIVSLMMALGMGAAVAAVALVSQYMGAEKKEMANKAATQVFVFMFIIAIVISILGFIGSPFILKSISVPPSIFDLVLEYIRIIFIGMPFMFATFAFSFILRGLGDTRTAVKIMGGSLIMNMILDPLMIFGIGFFPRLEVTGAALATVISRAFVGTIAIYLLFSGKVGIKLERKYMMPEKKFIKKVLSIGMPASIGQSAVAFGFIILMKFVNEIGVVAIGAYGVGNRLTGILFTVTQGITMANTTIVGQNLGADQVERAEKSVWRSIGIVFSILAVGSVAIFISRQWIFKVFIDDPAVIAEGTNFVKIFVFSLPFFSVFQTVGSTFQGSGQTKYQMVIGLIRLWGLRLPLCYLFAFILSKGATGIWLGMMLSNILGSLVALGFLRTGKWKKTVI